MSLFSVSELVKEKKEVATSGAVRASGSLNFKIGKAHEKLVDAFGSALHQDDILPYVSLGDWSTHDLLFYILEQTGPAKVWFTTWAISEYAIRQLYLFAEQGLILQLKGIFDYRNGIRKPAELQFLQKITTEIKPAKCHAKVTVVENGEWGVTIVGSANFTRNPRIEAGTLFTCRNVADFQINWIERELANKSVFNGNE